jgi:MinD-like ATPase involved in chromosome partitioning or flagellar assembly
VLLGLVSAKGSPGVTTTALAFAAVADDGLVVELDPSGGSIECWTGATGEPGLTRVASGLRRSAGHDAVLEHVVEAPHRVRAILAPTAGLFAESTVAMTRDRLAPALRDLGGTTVVLDGGRWSRSQPTAHRVAACDLVGIVCAPTVDGVEAARWLVEPLQAEVAGRLVVLLVGERPYPASEVALAIGLPTAGALAWDPGGVSSLLTRGIGRGWARSPLARSARSALAKVRELIPLTEEGHRAG